jgi:hypothetical protein
VKKSPTNKKGQGRPKPELKWQTGAYDRHAEYKFILPYQFLLLCKLMDVTPEKVIRDFMENLSCDSWKRQGKDKAKEHLINYFIEYGYGQCHYTEEDIRTMFKEMDALGLLFPVNAKENLLNAYAKWRDKHNSYWFKQWFRKTRRKLSKSNPL